MALGDPSSAVLVTVTNCEQRGEISHNCPSALSFHRRLHISHSCTLSHRHNAAHDDLRVRAGTPASSSSAPSRRASALIALPFLFPFTAGPSASVWQQLATWTCAALLLLAGPAARPGRGALAWLAGIGVLIVLGRLPASMLSLYAAGAVAVVAGTACVGAGLARAPASRQFVLRLGPPHRRPPQRPAGPAPVLRPGRAAGPLDHHARARPGLRQPAPAQPVRHPDQHGADGGAMAARQRQPSVRARRCADRRRGLAAAGGLGASTSRTGLLQLLLIGGISACLAWRERHAPPG